jgi:S-DNA-T family DNA segregation ATPase FtsK/SpoIIIE
MNKKDLSQEQLTLVMAVTMKFAELGHELTLVDPISVGPMVTTYRFTPKNSTRVKQIENLSEDIALMLGAESVMIKRMPGESAIGVTIPNKERTSVLWRDTVKHVLDSSATIPLNFGVDALGRPFVEDLALLPHLLIAGSTGGGKSTLLSSLITSLIYAKSSSQVQLALSDTKGVEFLSFIGSQHLIDKPDTTVYATLERMDWLNDETERRMKGFAKLPVKNISEYNQAVAVGGWAAGMAKPLPYIILVIDEIADLMDGGKRGEAKLADSKLGRIVARSRASGIHVIAATQRPSVDVISGSIKSNLNARLTFRLPTETDSRTVLGTGGAEHLLSRGDMLYASPLRPGLTRLHSALTSSIDIQGALDAARMREQMQGQTR